MNRLLLVILRTFFRLLYHEFAWTYDLVAWVVSRGRWQSWIRTILPFIHGTRLLELGFGPGHLQTTLAEQGHLVFGLDASEQMGRQAFRRLVKTGIHPRLVLGNASQLPFSESSLDQVLATFPSEYIIHPDTLRETYRVLRPGGDFIILPVAWITAKNPLDRLLAWLFTITGQAPDWDPRWLIPFQAAGFEATFQHRDLGDSKVLIVQATKGPISANDPQNKPG